MYGSSAVAQVKEDALTTFEQCEQINMDYCRKKILQSVHSAVR